MTKPIRQIYVEGNIAIVPLTRGFQAIIDADCLHIAQGANWSAMVPKSKAGKQYSPYAITGRGILLHREIMQAGKGQIVDHINGDTLDNRRSNLRFCTHVQNMQNSKNFETNTSGHRGVWFRRDRGRWISEIYFENKKIHIGSFCLKEDAAKAYEEKSKELFGNFKRYPPT